MKVIDSSALVKYFAREEGWEKVRQLIIEEGIITLELAFKELANSLWKKTLRGEIDYKDSLTIIRDLAYYKPIRTDDQSKYIEEAFSIAVKHKLTVYDSLFIALAKTLGKELVTSDRRQTKIAIEEGVKVILV